jgi:hypothetical protein
MKGVVVVLLITSASASLSQPYNLDARMVLGRLIFVIFFCQICMDMFCFVSTVLLGRQNTMNYLFLTPLQTSPKQNKPLPKQNKPLPNNTTLAQTKQTSPKQNKPLPNKTKLFLTKQTFPKQNKPLPNKTNLSQTKQTSHKQNKPLPKPNKPLPNKTNLSQKTNFSQKKQNSHKIQNSPKQNISFSNKTNLSQTKQTSPKQNKPVPGAALSLMCFILVWSHLSTLIFRINWICRLDARRRVY